MKLRRTPRHGKFRSHLPAGACLRVLGVGLATALLGRPVFASPASGPTASADGAAAAAVAVAGPDALATASTGGAEADIDLSFDRSLLAGGGRNTDDLERFENGNPVLPGVYNVDLYLNDVPGGRTDVRFAAPAGELNATPCITRALLDALRLHPALSEGLMAQLVDPAACVDMGSVIPHAQAHFQMSELRLDISVPQASMGQMPRGYVDPQYWDDGVTAGLLNYNFNSYHTRSRGISQTSSYLSLNAGINVGRWHLRHDSSLTWQSGSAGTRAHHQWENIDTYAGRDLPKLHAQLVVGDSYTRGELFDSVSLRGVQVMTDDRMLPDSRRGYAPVVRGVAQTNAKVVIRQNGVLLYQTTVAPGPFVINDLYPTGYGGDLDVEVTEADGRVQTFSVPYASVAQLLRAGTTRFSAAAGQLRNESLVHRQLVTQGTVQHGFNNLFTGYAGLAGAQGYGSVLLGGAFNTRVGALALDITSASTRLPGSTMAGRSVRLTFSKTLPQTGTSLAVAAYRYSTSGYLSLADAMLARDYARRGLPALVGSAQAPIATDDNELIPGVLGPDAPEAGSEQDNRYQGGWDRQRNRFNISLSQRLGGSGALSLNASVSDYWNRKSRDTQFQASYSNHVGRLGYSLSAVRTRDLFGRTENRFFASFSMPLGNSPRAPSLNANLGHDRRGWQEQASLAGSAGSDSQFTYGATVAHDAEGSGASLSVNGGYRGPFVVGNVSAGQGSGYRQASLNLSGAVVAHPGGLTFGQPTGDTVGIVVAKHAEGARVLNAAGARVDSDGFALIPYLTAYSLNTISIDPKGLSLDVQLASTSTQVAPRAGAVVMVKFKTDYGRSMMLRARLPDGHALPFGAQVVDAQGTPLGVVGQGGRMLVRGLQDTGRIRVQWQQQDVAKTCSFTYTLPPREGGNAALDQAPMPVTCEPLHGSRPAHEGST